MAILHQRMPQVAHLRFAALRLLIQPSIRIGSRLVRFVTPLLPMKIHFLPVRRGRFAPVLRSEAFVAGPSFDQRAIHREVLIRQIWLGSFQHPLEKGFGHLFVQQPFPVLAEHGVIPHHFVHSHTHKPAEQQVVVQLLHQQSL